MEKNKTVKLTSDELTEVIVLNEEYQEALIKLGQLSLKKTQIKLETESIEKGERECISTYAELEKKETNFKDRIFRKYGDGKLDINAGTYIISKNNG
jgi:hypothetical protein